MSEMNFVPSSDLRKRAWNALKPVFPIALLVALCAELPSLAGQVGVMLTRQPMLDAITTLTSRTNIDPNEMLLLLERAVTPGMKMAGIVSLVLALFTPFLNLGRCHFTLKLLRGEACEVPDVLSRRGIFFKAIGQSIYIAVKVILWMLLGYLPVTVMLTLFMAHPKAEMINAVMFASSASVILALVLGIRASLHYSMAGFIMADDPQVGIRESVRKSLEIMRSRKLAYFLLLLSFIGWMLLQSIAQSLLMGISTVVGATIGMALDLALAVYVHTSEAAFYEAYRSKSEASNP